MNGAAAKLGAGPGAAKPFGCAEVDKPRAAKAASTSRVNFALCAPGSRAAWLALAFPEEHPGLEVLGAKAGQEILLQLDGSTNRSGDTWHVEIQPSFPAKGAKYAWLLDPPLGPDGLPSAAAKRIIDPCARELDSPSAQQWNVRGPKRYSPWAVVPDPRAMQKFDWQGVKPPGLRMKDLVIYEAHVRGFTKSPDSGVTEANAGTFLGFVEKIPHLLKLGINCVEFLPVFEFDETACPRKNPTNGEQLCNYWGYSTVAFFVPMQRFTKRDQTSGAIVGFKTLVRELHRQGIEVILDVVFNHTAEGTWGESNWHSQSAVAKSRYYLLSQGKDTNYTGCGNTMNANDGLCADWICDCLRYWVSDMHVDGFRFDLASSLCRGGDGKIQHEPHLIKKMLSDPVLSRTKLIAEPWDCSWPDGYLVGKFPSCGSTRWAEWNGVWRDAVRRFIKGDPCMKSDFATRMCGSSDLYRHDGRSPFHSINFITAHDGFTLYDLVSYNDKQNYCNGENSGDDHNNSWNCGHEGHTGDGTIMHLRDRQMRNFLAALFLSIGTPMMVFGDEYGRTQHGCNNGWCQDSLSWFSWDGCSKQESRLFRFCRLLIAFRKRHSRVFCRDGFLLEKDIWWRTYWDEEYSYLCWVLHDNHDGKYDGILIAFNAGHETRSCDLPSHKEWYRIVDTNLPSPKDICEDEKSATKIGSGGYTMAPRSCIVLKCFADKAGAYDAKLEQNYLDQQRLEDHLESIAQRRMSMEFDMKRTLSRVSFSRQVSDEQAEEQWQRTMSQSLMKRQSMMSGFILETEGADGEREFVVHRPNGNQAQLETQAAAKRKADEEAAAKRKADEEASAKRKADEEAAAKKKEPCVLENPEDGWKLLSGKRVLHVKGFGSGFGDVPADESQQLLRARQDEVAAQAIERFCPDFLVVDGDPWGSGFQRYIKAYADRQVSAGLAVPKLVWVKNVSGSSPTAEEREKRLKQAREWADQGLPVVVSWLPDAKISEGVDKLFGAGCWKKMQAQKFDFRGAVRMLEAAESSKPEWLRRLTDTAPGREMHSAIKAVEGRADKKFFEKCSFENAAKGNAIYQHLRGEGHKPAAQGAVSFGGGESVLLEFATLYLSPGSGFDAGQAALFPFSRDRPSDPTLPAHEGHAFKSAQVCFKVTCKDTKPGEEVFIVGSSPQLGAWDPAKGIVCVTTAETFPVWTSAPVSMHTAAEFKIVVQHAERRDGARWESSGNKSVEGAALAGADSLTLSCSWGSLEVTATRT